MRRKTARKRAPPKPGQASTSNNFGAASVSTIAGKRIIVVDTVGESTVDDLKAYLSKFDVREVIRELCLLAVEANGEQAVAVEGVVLPVKRIPFMSWVAILCGTENGRAPSRLDIAAAAQIVNQLVYTEPTAASGDTILAVSRAQPRSVNHLHAIARTWLVFVELWDEAEAKFSVDDALVQSTGLTLRKTLVLSFLFGGRAARFGFASRPRSQDEEDFLATRGVSPADVGRYLSNVATTRAGFMAPIAGRHVDEHLRLNLFNRHPIFIPDSTPGDRTDEVFLPITHALMIERFCYGVYWDLVSSKGVNGVSSALGHAFQRYVGRLLKRSDIRGLVVPEVRYGKNGGLQSCDWLVIEGDSAVLIEVKLANIPVMTRAFGTWEEVQERLSSSLWKAADQLESSRAALASGTIGLGHLRRVKRFQKAVVFFEPIQFVNSFYREDASKRFTTLNDVHFICAEEFEHLLQHVGRGSLFRILREKSCVHTDFEMDFEDWIARRSRGRLVYNRYLTTVYNQLCADVLHTTRASASTR
jgi:hypothetical protein